MPELAPTSKMEFEVESSGTGSVTGLMGFAGLVGGLGPTGWWVARRVGLGPTGFQTCWWACWYRPGCFIEGVCLVQASPGCCPFPSWIARELDF